MTAPRPSTTAAARGASPNVVRQARGTRSRRGFFVALALVALAGIAIIAGVVQRGTSAATAGPIVVPAAPAGPGARPVGYTLGNPNAPVEIVEYADFECSVCGQYFAVTEPDVRKQLVEPGLARYTLYDIQVNAAHANSPAASLAAACANEQGKFWPMHDLLFGGQDEWNSQVTTDPRPVFARYAQQLGLDMGKWNACYDARRGVQHLAVNRANIERVPGFRGTPTFIIGDRLMQANATFDAIKAMVDSARTRAGATKPVAAR